MSSSSDAARNREHWDATADKYQARHGAFIGCGSAQWSIPDAGFDIVFCDHGAFGWAGPHLVMPEAARV